MAPMTCSVARLAANRSNCLKSTGPRTAEGKARSRANSHKHGMTGEGIARAEAGAEAIEASLAEVTTPMLARRVAVLADRLDRLAEHDEVATARRVREADGVDGGEDRHRELDALVASLGEEPAAAVRKLKRSAEGVDRLLGLWDDLARDLEAGRAWTEAHRDLATRLSGRAPGEIGVSRFEVLSAVEGEGRAADLAEIAGLVAAEAAALRTHREALAPVDPARDRLERRGLALFDSSKQGDLFRRYELATERNFYKALAEIRKAAALGLVEEESATEIPPKPPTPPLASFGAGAPTSSGPVATPAPREVASRPAPVSRITASALPADWAGVGPVGEASRGSLGGFATAPRTERRPRLPKR